MHGQWDIFFLIKEAYTSCVRAVCEKYGLTLMEFSLLLLLTNDPALDTAQKLVNTYHLSKSHVSTSLNTLEGKGLVQRLKSPGKRKNVCLRVLEPGRAVAAEGKQALGRLEQTLEQGLGAQEVKLLNDNLNTIKVNLQHYIHTNQKEQNLL